MGLKIHLTLTLNLFCVIVGVCVCMCVCVHACMQPHVGSGVVRINMLHFLAGCRKRRLNLALSISVLLHIAFFIVLLLIRAIFCSVILSWFVCVLSFSILVKLSVLAK